MTNVLFSGCSYFAGAGLAGEKANDDNVVNVFSKEAFGACTVNNIAENGNSNLTIYTDTAAAMYEQHYDYVFVGITSYPRYNFYMGFEPYDFKRRVVFSPFSKTFSEHNGHSGEFSSAWLQDLRNKFLAVHNDHFEILEIIKYQNLLLNQAKLLGTKLYFVNNLAHWDQGYFTKANNTEAFAYTLYTKKLLDFENRNDDEINTLYNLMHTDYSKLGSVQEQHWLNLYEPFLTRITDLGSDHYHPGPRSHREFGKFLAGQLNNI